MDKLFTLRWWQIGRYGRIDAVNQDTVHDEKVEAAFRAHGDVVMVEKA